MKQNSGYSGISLKMNFTNIPFLPKLILFFMINRLYNPWQITNSGEREADRHFSLSKGKEDELVSIVHQLRISSRFHKTQMSGGCDFVVFATAGIMVIEVKGDLIGFGKTDKKWRFYKKKHQKLRN